MPVTFGFPEWWLQPASEVGSSYLPCHPSRRRSPRCVVQLSLCSRLLPDLRWVGFSESVNVSREGVPVRSFMHDWYGRPAGSVRESRPGGVQVE
jgi:hypothetical protein